MRLKKKLISAIFIITVILCLGTLIYFSYSKIELPSGDLSAFSKKNEYAKTAGLDKIVAVCNEMYLLNVPSKSKNNGSYTEFDVNELIETKVCETELTDAVQIGNSTVNRKGKDIANKLIENGYINEYKTNYAAIQIGKLKPRVVVTYIVDVGETQKIAVISIINSSKKEDIALGMNAAKRITETVRINEERVETNTNELNELATSIEEGNLYEDLWEKTARDVILQNNPNKLIAVQWHTYNVRADRDYARMRFTFQWINTRDKPKSYRLYSTERGEEYLPITNGVGDVYWIIENVKKGDLFYFELDASTLGGFDYYCCDQDEYEQTEDEYAYGSHVMTEEEIEDFKRYFGEKNLETIGEDED